MEADEFQSGNTYMARNDEELSILANYLYDFVNNNSDYKAINLPKLSLSESTSENHDNQARIFEENAKGNISFTKE